MKGRAPIPAIVRFWALVTETDGCWLWTGSRDRGGYGRFYAAPGHHVSAHRFAFEVLKGVPPGNLKVCHTCDTPHCVRPDHLFLGTQLENVRDMIIKGRFREIRLVTRCKRGHFYDEKNTYFTTCRGRPSRMCRACQRARYHERKQSA